MSLIHQTYFGTFQFFSLVFIASLFYLFIFNLKCRHKCLSQFPPDSWLAASFWGRSVGFSPASVLWRDRASRRSTSLCVQMQRYQEIHCKALAPAVVGLVRPKSIHAAGRNGHCGPQTNFFVFRETSVSLLRPSADWMRPTQITEGHFLKVSWSWMSPHLWNTSTQISVHGVTWGCGLARCTCELN